MAVYPIKMLKDEGNNPFVPLVGTNAIVDPQGQSLDDKFATKLEAVNIIAGENITLQKVGNNITINGGAGSSVSLIDNLTTDTPGLGALDARQGKALKDLIPAVINNLNSTSTTSALSAYQGYLLKNRVVPAGGTTGQVLKKSSNADNAVEWGDNIIVENNLTSTSTTNALSAYQGYLLSNKFNDYLPKAGGTLTGVITFANSTFHGTNVPIISFGTAGGIGASTNADAIGVYGTTGIYMGPSSASRIVLDTTSLRPETGTWNLGTSGSKWSNVYATTLHGALDGNATSATKATQDGSGNTITSTYVKTSSKIPANSNLNDYTTTGFYYNPSNADVATMSNVPVNYAFSLLVEKHAGVKQTFTTYQTGICDTYVRNYYNGSWGTWKQVLTTTEIVNNLTTQSATAALSAAQGKALNDKITLVGSYAIYGSPGDPQTWTGVSSWDRMPYSTLISSGGSTIMKSNSSGLFTVGANIHRIKITATITYDTTLSSSEFLFVRIAHNNTAKAKQITQIKRWDRLRIEWIADVAENDTIQVQVYKDASGTISFYNYLTHFGAGTANYIMFEVLA